MSKIEKYAAAIFLYIISVYVITASKELPPEAAAFPKTISIILICLTTIYLYQVIKEKNKEVKEKDYVSKKLRFTIIATLLYVFTVDILGYFISTPVYLIAMMVSLELKNKKLMGFITLGVVAVLYIGFKVLLGVPVPTGIFMR